VSKIFAQNSKASFHIKTKKEKLINLKYLGPMTSNIQRISIEDLRALFGVMLTTTSSVKTCLEY
jgi:hypothetical protein